MSRCTTYTARPIRENDYRKVGQVKGNDTTYVDNIKDYRDSEGNFCYYVRSGGRQ
ncbi:MAG: hypothetical protein U5L96_04800 [Owenweeksia sp.]|nr:hypothetical protein [Owenweeksia sp.]